MSGRDTVNGMARDVMEHVVESTRGGLKSRLTPNDEHCVIEEVSFQQLGRAVACVSDTADEKVIIQDANDENENSITEEFIVLARAMSILERSLELCGERRKFFSSCQCAQRIDMVAAMKQTSIADHFCNN